MARRFDREWSDWDVDDGFPTITDVSAGLLDRMRDAPLVRPTVLEIGSGTGGLSVALLEMGARAVRGIDLSAASVELARRRAAAAGFDSQATFEVGEGRMVGNETYDWLVMDRVLCCERRAEEMLRAAMEVATRRIALSVPDSRGWRGLLNRPMWAAENVWDLARGGCRGFVHDLRAFERTLSHGGFRLADNRHVGLWHVGVYDRV
ncbi:MAG: class I SAM-dependent methyltransferase [Candidatus Limnocylindria bacterium]